MFSRFLELEYIESITQQAAARSTFLEEPVTDVGQQHQQQELLLHDNDNETDDADADADGETFKKRLFRVHLAVVRDSEKFHSSPNEGEGAVTTKVLTEADEDLENHLRESLLFDFTEQQFMQNQAALQAQQAAQARQAAQLQAAQAQQHQAALAGAAQNQLHLQAPVAAGGGALLEIESAPDGSFLQGAAPAPGAAAAPDIAGGLNMQQQMRSQLAMQFGTQALGAFHTWATAGRGGSNAAPPPPEGASLKEKLQYELPLLRAVLQKRYSVSENVDGQQIIVVAGAAAAAWKTSTEAQRLAGGFGGVGGVDLNHFDREDPPPYTLEWATTGATSLAPAEMLDDEDEDEQGDEQATNKNRPEDEGDLKWQVAESLRDKAAQTLRTFRLAEALKQQAKILQGLATAEETARADRSWHAMHVPSALSGPRALCYVKSSSSASWQMDLCPSEADAAFFSHSGSLAASTTSTAGPTATASTPGVYSYLPVLLVEEVPTRRKHQGKTGEGEGQQDEQGGEYYFDTAAKRPLQLLWYFPETITVAPLLTAPSTSTLISAPQFDPVVDFARVLLNRVNLGHFVADHDDDLDSAFGPEGYFGGQLERAGQPVDLATQRRVQNQALLGVLAAAGGVALPPGLLEALRGGAEEFGAQFGQPSATGAALATLTQAALQTAVPLILTGVAVPGGIFFTVAQMGWQMASPTLVEKMRQMACDRFMVHFRALPPEEISGASFGRMMAQFMNMLDRVAEDFEQAANGGAPPESTLEEERRKAAAEVRDEPEKFEKNVQMKAEGGAKSVDKQVNNGAFIEIAAHMSGERPTSPSAGAHGKNTGNKGEKRNINSKNQFASVRLYFSGEVARDAEKELRRFGPKELAARIQTNATSKLHADFQWSYPQLLLTSVLESESGGTPADAQSAWCRDFTKAYLFWPFDPHGAAQRLHKIKTVLSLHDAAKVIEEKATRTEEVLAEVDKHLAQIEAAAGRNLGEVGGGLGLSFGGPKCADANRAQEGNALARLRRILQEVTKHRQEAVSSTLVDMMRTSLQRALQSDTLQDIAPAAAGATTSVAGAAVRDFPLFFRDLVRWKELFWTIEREVPGRYKGNTEERRHSWVSSLLGGTTDSKSQDGSTAEKLGDLGNNVVIKVQGTTSPLVEEKVLELLLAASKEAHTEHVDLRAVVLEGLLEHVLKEEKAEVAGASSTSQLLEAFFPKNWFLVVTKEDDRTRFLRELLDDVNAAVALSNPISTSGGAEAVPGAVASTTTFPPSWEHYHQALTQKDGTLQMEDLEVMGLTQGSTGQWKKWGWREQAGATRQLFTGSVTAVRQAGVDIASEMDNNKKNHRRLRDRATDAAKYVVGGKIVETLKKDAEEGRGLLGKVGWLAGQSLDAARVGISATSKASKLGLSAVGLSSRDQFRRTTENASAEDEANYLKIRLLPKFKKWLYVDVLADPIFMPGAGLFSTHLLRRPELVQKLPNELGSAEDVG
eukprot:g14894.t1